MFVGHTGSRIDVASRSLHNCVLSLFPGAAMMLPPMLLLLLVDGASTLSKRQFVGPAVSFDTIQVRALWGSWLQVALAQIRSAGGPVRRFQ